MAKKKNGNATFIVGSVLGALAGAAFALWRTPMSGKELRAKLTPGPLVVGTNGDAQPSGEGFTDKVINVVERATAPLVGVELGKTANGSGNGSVHVTQPAPAEDAVKATTSVVTDTASTVTAAAAAAPADTYGTSSIRAKRFSWGDPAPTAVAADVTESTVAVAEQATGDVKSDDLAAKLEEAPVVETAVPQADTASTDTYGTASIRAKRFSWGEPAPVAAASAQTSTTPAEAVVDAIAEAEPTTTAEKIVEEASETVASPGETASSGDDAAAVTLEDMLEDAPETNVLSAPTSMHKFPKLGGLEND